MVKFENVTKKFGSLTALDDISFELEEGGFVFLTGPSGAGKTTLIRLLLRELKPDKGTILIEGKDIAKLSARDIPYYRRKIGVVFQDFKLLHDRTAYENVALGLEVSGRQENADQKIKKALEEVGILDKANLFPRQLAGGELQRTVLARALVIDPRIILADEPTGNLDPETGMQIVKLLDNLAEDGRTVIMASHNAGIVDSLKRHVIELKKGKLVRDKKHGTYKEALASHKEALASHKEA